MYKLHSIIRKEFRIWWQFQTIDIPVVSYPKSGRTWHRSMIGAYLTYKHDLDLRAITDVLVLTRKLGLPSVHYTHNGANYTYAVAGAHFTNATAYVWRGKRVILIVRELRDILVSAYHHARYRSCQFLGTIHEFIRHPHTGIEKILTS